MIKKESFINMAQQKYTAARKEGNRKWDAQNLDRISIALPKGSKDKIKAHAEKRGESINGFVGRAISETMQRDALELPGAGQTDPDTESKRAALLEKLQGVSAGDDSKE